MGPLHKQVLIDEVRGVVMTASVLLVGLECVGFLDNSKVQFYEHSYTRRRGADVFVWQIK